jgi:outer membrane protein OmpA-like peptidoglycan-associated protein
VTLSANETFYAQWTPAIQISFGDNGGVGTLSSLSGQIGTTITLPSSASLTDTGFTLTSWNTAANGLGASYTPGQSLTLSTSLTLYAQWTAIPSIAINFSANGGSGSLATLTGTSGTTVTLPSASSVVRTGYTLISWNTAANGTGTSYSPGQSLSLSSTLTLYAQWKATPTSTLYGSIGVFPKSTTTLSAGLKAQVARLAAVVKRKGYSEVTLFGYSADTGLASLDGSLSSSRATRVANYLQSELRAMNVTGVKISATGEGAVVGKTSSSYSTVEVFVQ